MYFVFNNKTVKVDPVGLKRMGPDERNISSFIKHTLDGRSFPGLEINGQKISDLIKGKKAYVLDVSGNDIREAGLDDNACYVLGDDAGLTVKVKGDKISLGPKVILTSHAIAIINNELDRREP